MTRRDEDQEMSGANTIQCPHCGASNNPQQPFCASCGETFGKKGRGEGQESLEKPQRPWQEIRSELLDDKVCPPPRPVPLPLTLMAFRPALVLLVAALVVVLAGSQVGRVFWTLLEDLPVALSLKTVKLSLAGLGWLFLVGLLWFGYRRYVLLRVGEASRAEVVEIKTSSAGYQNAHFYPCEGWQKGNVNYTGPSSKTILRLWGRNGASCTFKLGGIGYREGVYLMHPDNPKHHASVCSYGGSIIPGPGGQWKVWPQLLRRVIIELVVGGGVLGAALVYVLFLKG